VIQETRLKLSLLYAHIGWFVRFSTPAIARQMVRQARMKKAYCSWARISMNSYDPSNNIDEFDLGTRLCIDDKVLRIEYAPPHCKISTIQLFLWKFDVKAVQKLKLPRYRQKYSSFLVWCDDVETTRAVTREMMGVKIEKYPIRFYPYPKPILRVEGNGAQDDARGRKDIN